MPAPKGNQYAVGNPGGGRVSTYDPKYVQIAQKMCEMGATDLDLGDAFNVSESTIRLWRITHEDFGEALKVGKDLADSTVERSLYRRALGFEHDAVEIFLPKDAPEPVYAPYRKIVPPDTTACIFWLKNRRSKEWRDRSAVEHTGEVGIKRILVPDRVATKPSEKDITPEF